MRGKNKLFGIVAILLCATSALAFDGIGGGGSFNAAAPGAIGGTTSNTGQFTKLAVGASVPTLPTHTGAAAFLNPNGDANSAFIDEQGVNFIGLWLGVTSASASNYFVSTNGTTAFINAANTLLLTANNNGVGYLQVSANQVIGLQGSAIQSASSGGTAPTCSSGTGTCTISTGSTNNRGQMVLAGGTAVVSLTLTFSISGSWGQAPFCNFTSSSGSIGSPASGACGSTAACVATIPSSSAIQVNYMCM